MYYLETNKSQLELCEFRVHQIAKYDLAKSREKNDKYFMKTFLQI